MMTCRVAAQLKIGPMRQKLFVAFGWIWSGSATATPHSLVNLFATVMLIRKNFLHFKFNFLQSHLRLRNQQMSGEWAAGRTGQPPHLAASNSRLKKLETMFTISSDIKPYEGWYQPNMQPLCSDFIVQFSLNTSKEDRLLSKSNAKQLTSNT